MITVSTSDAIQKCRVGPKIQHPQETRPILRIKLKIWSELFKYKLHKAIGSYFLPLIKY